MYGILPRPIRRRQPGVNERGRDFQVPQTALSWLEVRTSSRNVAVLLFDEVELLDVASLMQVLSLAGRHYNWRPFRLCPVARAPGLIETRSQLRVEARHSLESCPAPEIVYVPGGYGARRAAQDEAMVDWCRRTASQASLVLASGAGVAVLAAAELLDGASVAVASDVRPWLAGSAPGVHLDERQPVVTSRDGRLITAAASGHVVELGLRVVESCLGRRIALGLRASLGSVAVERLDFPAPLTLTAAVAQGAPPRSSGASSTAPASEGAGSPQLPAESSTARPRGTANKI